MTDSRLLALLLATLLSTSLAAASDWLPEDGAESLAQQLAVRLADTLPHQDAGEEQILAAARAAVASIMSTIDLWGIDQLAERAPTLEQLGMPFSDSPYLTAMARYGACNFHLDALYGNRALDDSAPSIRVTAAIASAAIPLASAALRHRFLAEGGTDAHLRAFLGSEEMTTASLRIEGNRELISYSWKECAPTLAALTGTTAASGEESAGETP